MEFDLSQQPGLVAKLSISHVELLQQALASHRYALNLNNDNTDILFNTAQVMISIAEHAADAGSGAEGIPLLHEAVEILSACFSMQEDMLREEQRVNSTEEAVDSEHVHDRGQPEGGDDDDDDDEDEDDDDDSEAEAEYATIQAPITIGDLLDTSRASLNALTLLANFSEPSELPKLVQMAQTLTNTTIPQLIKSLPDDERAETEPEVQLESAEFIAALASAEFKTSAVSFPEILSRLAIFDQQFDLETNVPAMCIYADALVDLSSTAVAFGSADFAPSCWTQLTKAQDLYARAVKVNNDETKDRKAQIYESRGDVEMLRFRLASAPEAKLSASVQASAPTLIKNAGTYYRGACNLFRADGDVVASKKAEIRGLIAGVLGEKISANVGPQVAALKQNGNAGAAVATDMMREGLLGQDWDEGLA